MFKISVDFCRYRVYSNEVAEDDSKQQQNKICFLGLLRKSKNKIKKVVDKRRKMW